MISAFFEGNQYGFEVIDDNYLDIVDYKLIGTLGIGSRRSSFFIRIYTKHKLFVRWETELKRSKSQKLFDKLADLAAANEDGSPPVKTIVKALLNAALDQIDFRDNSRYTNSKHASRSKTDRLIFWESFLTQVCSLIENIADSNDAKDTLDSY